ncbi:hypothetical protein [Flagellimonas sp.]|uniref:hypothetical protein n=1 Tax=Flagellimonas sp. TaxID=2058762 RepID=UPI003B5A75A6
MPSKYTYNARLDPGIFSIVARSCKRDIPMESWAEGVETTLTNDRYSKGGF